MVKLRLTIVGDYEVNPESYETNDPSEIAKIDEIEVRFYLEDCLDWLDSTVLFNVEVVEEENA